VISVVAASALLMVSPAVAFILRESADAIHEKETVRAVPELPDWRRLVAIATPHENRALGSHPSCDSTL